MQEKILQLLYAQAREMGEETGQQALLNPGPETKLYHADGNLDSLGLVTFIAGVEEKIADAFGVDLLIVDEKAMSQHSSPFISMKTLATYIENQLQTENQA